MPVKFATGWTARTTSDLSTSATVIPVPMAAHASFVAAVGASEAAGHTFLVLSNGSATEIVRAYAQGSSIRIERGTPAIAVPAGACVNFEVTQNLLDGYMTPEDTITEIEAGDGISVTRDGNTVTISLKECENPVSWTVGNSTYTLDQGCVVETPASSGGGCTLAPGVYRNATITVSANGQICSVVQGANIVFSNDPCCQNCEE